MSNSRILIVDDNIDFGFSLGEILKDEGYEVVNAGSGEEALEIFQDALFDLVLLDMKLPRILITHHPFGWRRRWTAACIVFSPRPSGSNPCKNSLTASTVSAWRWWRTIPPAGPKVSGKP